MIRNDQLLQSSVRHAITNAAVLLSGLAAVAGCSSSSPRPVLAPGGASSAFVVQEITESETLLELSLGQNGVVAPGGNPKAPVGHAFAIDRSGKYYVGVTTSTGYAVQVYPSAQNSTAPVRTVVLPSDFGSIYFLVVDQAGKLYVAMETALLVYTQNADGSSTLEQEITGPATGINIPGWMAVTSAGDIYVDLTQGIGVYPAGATGDVAPARLITSPANSGFGGIAIDSIGNIYTSYNQYGKAAIIVEFAPGATGLAPPVKQITAPSLGIGYIYGMQLDASGNLYAIYNAIDSNGGGVPVLVAFSPEATGQVTPSLKISSTAWTLTDLSLAIE